VRTGKAAFAAFLSILLLAPAASAAVTISFVQYDSPGNDTGSSASLNAEYVMIENNGSRPIQLTNWTLRDRASHVYHFAYYVLRPHRSVRVHTGTGNDHIVHLYQDSDSYIWENGGDTATLRRRDGFASPPVLVAGRRRNHHLLRMQQGETLAFLLVVWPQKVEPCTRRGGHHALSHRWSKR
jgi:Lamin Tail Domain